MSDAQATRRWRSAGDTGRASRSSRAPGQEEVLDCMGGRGELVALDRAGRVDVLGADSAALTDEGAGPDPFGRRLYVATVCGALVPRVQVVALGQRDRRRAYELRVERVDRAGRVAEHAVDAHAELLVLVQLVGRLQVFARLEWTLHVADHPRFDGRQLVHEVTDVDDEVADQ